MHEVMFYLPANDSVSHGADAMGVGDRHWGFHETGFFHPCGPGHFPVAVQGKPTCKDRVAGLLATRQNHRNAGAHRTFAHFKCAGAADQGCVPDLNTTHIRDGIRRARSSLERDA